MKRPGCSACLGLGFLLVLFSFAYPAQADQPAAPPKPADVDAAIKNGIDYLEGIEDKGSWDDINEHRYDNQQQKGGGYTAVATYALLTAGVKPTDAHIVDAVDHLELIGPQMTGIYALGMRCQVWASLPRDPKLKPFIRSDAIALIDAAKRDSVKGMYRYTINDPQWDISASQYGVLGLWACANLNLEVPTDVWQMMENAWIAKQYADGAWAYQGGAGKDPDDGHTDIHLGGSTTMTAAGIASLFVTQEFLHGEDGVNCNGNVNNAAIDKGMAYLSQHAADMYRFPPYTLYAYSRIGVAGGYKYFGTYNWYAEGAAILLKNQQPDGSFTGGGFGGEDLGPVADTSLALLFLSRGRGPVILNKLEYTNVVKGAPDKDTRWNQRPRDAANVTRWIGKELESELNWQLINLNVPVSELHDAPILYITGGQPILLSDDQEKKLRTFVEEGGVILGNADCGARPFVEGFKQLGHRLFPDYEPVALKKDSAVFNIPAVIKEHHEVIEINNGIRPLMLLLTDDPAKQWQRQAGTSHPADFQLMENILLYVQDAKHLMSKGESYIVAADPAIPAGRQIKVARMQYGGNWNPEPGGWRRLAAIEHNTRKTELQIDTVKLGDGKLDNHYAVADFTGTVAFKLTDAERAELKKYIDAGGTAIFDAGGGSGAFGDSARAEIAALYPDAKLRLLPSAHPVLQSDGKPIEAEYREIAKKIIHGHSARLMGADINGRTAIFFSGEDLTSALVGQPLSNVVGYDPATASLLMGNMLDYAVNPHVAPASAPASAPTSAPATQASKH